MKQNEKKAYQVTSVETMLFFKYALFYEQDFYLGVKKCTHSILWYNGAQMMQHIVSTGCSELTNYFQ